MSRKVDVISKRTQSTGSVSGGPARLRQLMIKAAASGSPRIILKDGEGGTNLLDITFAVGDTHSINIPGNGVRFENEIWLQNKTNITAMTFFWS